jgi:hypothetical protein
MLSDVPREALENIFSRLPPERLDMLMRMCSLVRSVSTPLLFDFLVKRQRQKIRTMFFDIYDRLRAELNIHPSLKPIELRANDYTIDQEPWIRAVLNTTKLFVALLDSSGHDDNIRFTERTGIHTSDLKGNAIYIKVIDNRNGDILTAIWLHHNRIAISGAEYPFPEDPYVFVRNALNGTLPEGFPTRNIVNKSCVYALP